MDRSTRDLIEEVCERICGDYCKYVDRVNRRIISIDQFEEICETCPLQRLHVYEGREMICQE